MVGSPPRPGVTSIMRRHLTCANTFHQQPRGELVGGRNRLQLKFQIYSDQSKILCIQEVTAEKCYICLCLCLNEKVGLLQTFKFHFLFKARNRFSLLLILLDHPHNKDWLLLNIGLIANVNQTMPSDTWLNSGGGSLH